MKENFEEKLALAKNILEKLSDPEITLSVSMEEYKKGLKALQEASAMLENAKIQYEELNSNKDGKC